ncbi:hypothetical protein Tco_0868937 [Tanacetum coccineum]
MLQLCSILSQAVQAASRNGVPLLDMEDMTPFSCTGIFIFTLSFDDILVILGDLTSPVQTRDYLHCLFACFLSQLEPSSVAQALNDPAWIEAMQEEMQQFINQKMTEVIVVGNKARFRGFMVIDKVEGIDYDESAFLYWGNKEEVYVSQPKGFEDPHFPKHVYKCESFVMVFIKARGPVQVYVDDIIFGSTKQAWCDEFEVLMKGEFKMSAMDQLIGSHMYLTAFRPVMQYDSQWFPIYSPFVLDDNCVSDFVCVHGIRKSKQLVGCQFLGKRIDNHGSAKSKHYGHFFPTVAEYVAAAKTIVVRYLDSKSIA